VDPSYFPSIIHAFWGDLFVEQIPFADHSINISYTHALIGIIDGFPLFLGKGSLSLCSKDPKPKVFPSFHFLSGLDVCVVVILILISSER